MRLLTRYVLWEVIKVFATTLFVLTTLLMVIILVRVSLREGLGIGPLVRLLPYALPFSMRFTVPATMLYSVCAVFGRMSADQEITAIKASGVSPWAIMRPAIILALFISPLAVWVNDLAVSWGQRGIQQVILRSVEQIAYSMLQKKGAYNSDQFSIRVARVEDRRLIEPIITVRMEDIPITTITASEAVLRANTADDTLVITMVDAEIEYGDSEPVYISQHTYVVPLSAASRQGALSDRPSDLAWSRIPAERKLAEHQVETIRTSMAAEAAFQMLSGDLNGLGEQRWSQQRASLRQSISRLHRLETERWRRTAIGFSCFFFVLVGAPVAIYLKNADFLSCFFICFFPILLIYFPMLMLGVDRAKAGALPPYSVWMGNVAFAAAGAWLIHRVIQDRPGPSFPWLNPLWFFRRATA